MKSKILSQVFYDMKHQPVIGIVTVIGTSLAIFLMMVVVMMDRVNVASFAPEVNRYRTLYGKWINTVNESNGSNSSSAMTAKTARQLYDNLDGAECTTLLYNRDQRDVMVPGKPASMRYVNLTDHNFWKIYEFNFLAGRPFDENSFESSAQEAVISESTARSFFGSIDVLGETILISQKPFKIIGVVADVSQLAREAYAEVFASYRAYGVENEDWGNDVPVFGPYSAVILAESPATYDRIRADIQTRKQQLNAELSALDEGLHIVDHGAPYTQEEVITVRGSNTDPDTSQGHVNLIIYAILLIVPAINLSSMTQSRLYRRISEIGVKRAFGATRTRIVGSILAENFMVTLAGGIIGLVLCFVFGFFFSDMIFTGTEIERTTSAPLQILFDWKIYGMALLFCFILNLLSSGIPAWRASRIDPVRALSGKM